MKKLFFDMDGVLVDFQSGIDQLTSETLEHYKGRLDDVPGIFHIMHPLKGSQKAVQLLSKHYDCYILTTSPWNNPTAASDKINWVKRYYPNTFHKKVIITHRKDLVKGDYLIDDRTARGADEFEGEHIYFGRNGIYPDWDSVLDYLREKENIVDN